jgi:hypothetical protein
MLKFATIIVVVRLNIVLNLLMQQLVSDNSYQESLEFTVRFKVSSVCDT